MIFYFVGILFWPLPATFIIHILHILLLYLPLSPLALFSTSYFLICGLLIIVFDQNVYHEFFPIASVGNGEMPYSNISMSEEIFERIPQGCNSLGREIAGNVISSHGDLSQKQLPQFNQLPSQLQFDHQSEAQSREVTLENQCGNDSLKVRSLMLNQFPVEQESDILQQQPSVLPRVGASYIADSSNLSIQDILLLYIHYNNDLQHKGNNQATFLNKLHYMQCRDNKCTCDMSRALICHYENCSYRFCSICKPVRELCSVDTVESGLQNLKSDPLKAIHEREFTGSGKVESAIPPPKRMRMEDCFLSENVPSALSADSVYESFRSSGTSQYKRWCEGPLCNEENEEVMKIKQLRSPEYHIQATKTEQLYSAEDPVGASERTANHTPESSQRMAYGNAPSLPKELNCGTGNCDGLNNDILPVLKQPNVVQEKGEIQSMSKPNQPESKAKAESSEAATDHQSGTRLEDSRKLPVSLVDFLNSMQIKEHIGSLSHSVGQVCMMF